MSATKTEPESSQGKRPIYLSTVLIAAGIAIWGPFINSTAAWYGQSAILGFTNAPSFATAEASVADVVSADVRSSYGDSC